MSKPSILLLSHDTRGLGSFRRQCNIAAALCELAPEIAVLLATSCDIPPPPFIQVLQLPDFHETDRRASLLLHYVQLHRPRAILVDKHPFGVNMDFKSALTWAGNAGIPCFYGLRDILDDPERVRAEWLDLIPSIDRYFRRILIYGEIQLFNAEQYGLPRSLLEYCGFVSGFPGGSPGVDGVLCTVGAGDSDLAHKVLRIFANARFSERTTIVTGPYGELQANGAGTKNARRHCSDMEALWSTHRAVVCLGGYNTLIEAITFGLHVVCIPRIAPRLEQLLRAQIFAKKGWLHCVHPNELSEATLETLVATPLTPAGRPAIDGGQRAARTILHEAGLHS